MGRVVVGIWGGLLLALVAMSGGVPALGVAASPAPSNTPELPRLSVDTTEVVPSGQTLVVPAGGNFQAALNAAKPGDVISLEAGATFTGPFTLPRKSGSGWIIVRTSASDGHLPPPRTRVTPSFAPLMPKLEAGSGSVLTAAPGAHHYRFIGIEIRPKRGVFLYNLVLLGARETSLEAMPRHIVFDRCYLHGDPKKGTRRGIAMNGQHLAVLDSHLADFKEVGADSQAIAGWNGPGPFKIINNFLEGAGENVLFGGGDPSIPNLVPSDIEIRQNHMTKPLSWKVGDPAFAGTPWVVKIIFELKNARRVLIEGNLFENHWAQPGYGFGIVFTPRNQDGGAPWSVVEDVTFVNNILRRAAGGINILGRDDNYPSEQTKRILIKNNLFEGVGGATWGTGRPLFQLLDETEDIVIVHNTAFQAGSIILAVGKWHRRFTFAANIVPHNEYGIVGAGTGSGNPTIQRYFPHAIIEHNLIVGGRSELYPPGNFFAPSLDEVGFADRGRGDYRLSRASRYRRVGMDGKVPGVDFDALCAALTESSRRPAERQAQPPCSPG